jgi:hypothetical protein
MGRDMDIDNDKDMDNFQEKKSAESGKLKKF